jgi:hypothetical protein
VLVTSFSFAKAGQERHSPLTIRQFAVTLSVRDYGEGGGDKGLSLCIDYRSTFRFLLSIPTSSFPSFCYYRLGASRYCRSSTRIASFLRTSRLALCFVIWRSRVHISVRRSPLLIRCSWFYSVTSRQVPDLASFPTHYLLILSLEAIYAER